jgi:hypothetical protein
MKLNDTESVYTFFRKLLLLLFPLYIVIGFLLVLYLIVIGSDDWGVVPPQLKLPGLLYAILGLIIFALSFCLFMIGLFSYFKLKPGKQKSYAKSMIFRGIVGMIAAFFLFLITNIILGLLIPQGGPVRLPDFPQEQEAREPAP